MAGRAGIVSGWMVRAAGPAPGRKATAANGGVGPCFLRNRGWNGCSGLLYPASVNRLRN